MKINVIPKSKLWLTLSVVFVVLSIAATLTFGLNPSIEFTGGSILEIQTESAQSVEDVRESFASNGVEAIVQDAGENQYIVRMAELGIEQKTGLVESLSQDLGTSVTELSFDSIGPVLGKELQRKSVIATLVLLLATVLYVAWTFRQVSQPVASWKYGVITIVTALHDAIIPVGVFAVVAHFTGYQVDVAFIAAILTILGYSINDTIVIFDRTRENVLRKRHISGDEFGELVNESVNQSAMRSVNTSLSSILALLAVFLFGGDTLRPFALTLMVGILAGAYSSIFMASPLLVYWQKKAK